MTKYYVFFKGKQLGPLDEERIRGMLEKGQLPGDSKISTDGQNWQPLGTVTAFSSVQVAQPVEQAASAPTRTTEKTSTNPAAAEASATKKKHPAALYWLTAVVLAVVLAYLSFAVIHTMLQPAPDPELQLYKKMVRAGDSDDLAYVAQQMAEIERNTTDADIKYVAGWIKDYYRIHLEGGTTRRSDIGSVGTNVRALFVLLLDYEKAITVWIDALEAIGTRDEFLERAKVVYQRYTGLAKEQARAQKRARYGSLLASIGIFIGLLVLAGFVRTKLGSETPDG